MDDELLLGLGLLPSQLAMESGGNQFWTSGPNKGKPKVSDAGAVGIAQVMPKTGPEAAKLAGLPWDPQRFYYDPAYNKKLGDAYQDSLNKKYGPGEVATAAYHQGPGNVDRALRLAKERGGDWRDYIGPKGQQYIGYKGKGNVALTPSQGGIPSALSTIVDRNIVDMRNQKPTPGEQNAMATVDPIGAALAGDVRSKVGAATGDMSERLSNLDTMLNGVITEVGAANAQQEQSLAKTVAIKKALNQQSRDSTDRVLQTAIPLFQRREALAARRREIAEMSPFKRFIKGTFDPRYDDKELAGRERANKEELDTLAEDLQLGNQLTDRLSALAEADYAGDSSLANLHKENLLQNVEMVSRSVAVSESRLNAAFKPLDNAATFLRMESAAKTEIGGRLSAGQVNQALEQAQNSADGSAVVEGVKFTAGELQKMQLNWQDIGMNLQSRTMALQSQQLGLAGQLEDKTIGLMSMEQVKSAIENGGQFGGQQLDMGKLTGAFKNLSEARQATLQGVQLDSLPGQVKQITDQVRLFHRQSFTRMEQMFGRVPDEQLQWTNELSKRADQLKTEMDAANAKGIGKEWLAANISRYQDLYSQQQKVNESVINKWSGGKKDIAAVGQAWLSGTPINGDLATQGLITMARSNLPPGVTLSGPAAQAFRAAKQIVADYEKPTGGMTLDAMFRTGKKSPQELQRLVQAKVSDIYSNYTMDAIIQSAPDIAQRVTVDGKAHPFAQVRKEDFRNSVAYGDQEGYERMGDELGLNVQQTKQLFSEGPTGPLWQKLAASKPGLDFGTLGSQLLARQSQATMQALDASPSAHEGFRPSRAFVDLMNNPQFNSMVGNIVKSQTQGSFGAFLIGNAGTGDFVDQFSGYAQGLTSAQATLQAQTHKDRIKRAQSNFLDPFKRAGYVMATVDDVSSQDRGALMGAIRKEVGGPDISQYGNPGLMRTVGDQQYNRITDIILNHKFEDKRVEAIRRRVAKQWGERDKMVQSMADMESEH